MHVTRSLAAALSSLLVACATTPQRETADAPRAEAQATSGVAARADWPSYNGTLEGTRYSALAQITPTNAARLQRACTFDSGEQMSMQSGPVVVDGVLYLTTDTSTYAIDAATCDEMWHTARSYEPLGMLKNNHGVAYMDGRLFRVHGGVHAYALDAKTGRVLWDVSFREREGESAPMAPIAWDGMVFVVNAGGDNIGVQGHVHALDAATGRELWTFDVIPDTGAPRATWPEESAPRSAPPTGGGMWSSSRTPILAGVTATAGGVVMAGDMGGQPILLDAETGKVLHEVNTGAPIGGGIITYQVDGRQYIAVAGGTISPIWPLPSATSRVTVFRSP